MLDLQLFKALVRESVELPKLNLQLFAELVRKYNNSPRADNPTAPQIGAHTPENGKSTTPGVPAWLHAFFSEGVGGIEWPQGSLVYARPLVGPSDIRAKYLLAMQKHVATYKCTFCLEVHAMEGEKYIVELERALTQARDKVLAFMSVDTHFLIRLDFQTTLEVF